MTRTQARTLYLIDVSSFIFRAFYAVRPLSTASGEPVNAVYGVATMLAKVMLDAKAEYVAIVFDAKDGSSPRKEKYPEYKANRSAPPDELLPQFDRIEELVNAMRFPSFRKSGTEADDLIATLTHKWRDLSPEYQVVIVSSDKDLMQLVDERTKLWDTLSNKFYSPPQVKEKFGVEPGQIRDYLALVGDSSDNIPGVPSIGPKTAADLLGQYQDLEGILKAAHSGKISGKKGEVLKSHEADARISQDLATLVDQDELQTDPQKLRYKFCVTDECAALLKSLEFHSLLTRWLGIAGGMGADEPSDPHPNPPLSADSPLFSNQAELLTGPTEGIGIASHRLDFRTVDTLPKLDELISAMNQSREFGFDLETTSLNPREAEIVGIAICPDPAYACYIPVGHLGTEAPQLPLGTVMSRLKPYLEDPKFKKIGQNLKYDWSVLLNQGIKPEGIGADTMVAAYVLEPEGRHNLEVLARMHLGFQVTTYEMVCGKGKDQVGFDQVPIDHATRYSAEDAWVAVQLWKVMQPQLLSQGLIEVFARVDLPLVPLLARMECEGICIDEEYLRALSQEFAGDLSKIETKIAAYTQGPVNLNSPKQLAHLLFEELKLPTGSKTKTGFSTDATVLEGLAPIHEVPRLLLEYREISKLKGTYVDPLPLLKDKKTGKIHASFHQTVAATGRLSSSDPNLQNIPVRSARGQKIRRAFVASPGRVLLSADYSQIELRILAHMSGDPELMRSFMADEDVHRRTASQIYGIDPERVTDEQRSVAKAINFGLMYGKTAHGLAQELKITRTEAQKTIDRYFERYRGVKTFLDEQIELAGERGWTATLLGRKRVLRDIRASNPMLRNSAERMAMNTPIQGTAADLMKLAMIDLDEALIQGKFKSKLIVQVHDEVLLDVVQAELPEVRVLVVDKLENAMKMSVPLKVNVSSGANWMDL